MTRQDDAGTRHRQRQLAGVLLVGAALFDALSGLGDVDDDPYVVVTHEGIFHLDVTGWMWAHLVTAVLVGGAGLLLFTGRRWSLRVAAAAAVVGIGVHLIVLPYQPLWALIVIGLAVTALRLLWRCRVGEVSDRPSR